MASAFVLGCYQEGFPTNVEMIQAGAEEHMDKLAKKYNGLDGYPWRRPSQVRLLIKIKPERVSGPDAQ